MWEKNILQLVTWYKKLFSLTPARYHPLKKKKNNIYDFILNVAR
jgi:hypothetical protein